MLRGHQSGLKGNLHLSPTEIYLLILAPSPHVLGLPGRLRVGSEWTLSACCWKSLTRGRLEETIARATRMCCWVLCPHYSVSTPPPPPPQPSYHPPSHPFCSNNLSTLCKHKGD